MTSGPDRPGAPLATSPQFGVPNQTDVFTVNQNGAVEVHWVSGAGAWQGPLAISPAGFAAPGGGVVASPQYGVPNQTDVFVVDRNGTMQVMWVQGPGAWQGPLAMTPAGATGSGAPLAASPQYGVPNQTDVFVAGAHFPREVFWVQGAGAWQGPVAVTSDSAVAGASLTASPQVGLSNQTDVFTTSQTGAVRVSWVQGAGAWQGPLAITPAGATFAGSAGLAPSPQYGVPNQTDVFTVSQSSAIQVSWVQGAGTWEGPLEVTPAGVTPSLAFLAASPQYGVPNQTDVFTVNNNGAVQVSWVDGAGAWQGPLAI